MAGTGISEADLLDKLRLIKTHRLLIVIDACYSGNISPSRTPQDETRNIRLINPPEESTIALLGTGSGRIIITSCRENQVSFIGTGTISIFTQALVDGLRGKGVHNNCGASASVTNSRMAGVSKINLQELRAVLEELWDALDTAQLQREQKRITLTAASNALDSVEGEEPQSTKVIENVKKIGDTIRQTNIIVEEGSYLWQSVLKLIHLGLAII